MPIYEYECNKCKNKKEVLLGSKEQEPTLCECGGELKRLFGLSSFILKGSGWYKTDYREKKECK